MPFLKFFSFTFFLVWVTSSSHLLTSFAMELHHLIIICWYTDIEKVHANIPWLVLSLETVIFDNCTWYLLIIVFLFVRHWMNYHLKLKQLQKGIVWALIQLGCQGSMEFLRLSMQQVLTTVCLIPLLQRFQNLGSPTQGNNHHHCILTLMPMEVDVSMDSDASEAGFTCILMVPKRFFSRLLSQEFWG